MTNAQIITLAIVYLPLIIVIFRSGGGIWKFLAFLFCTLTLITTSPMIFFGTVGLIFATANIMLGAVCWLIAWIFSGIAMSSIHRRKQHREVMLALTQERKAIR